MNNRSNFQVLALCPSWSERDASSLRNWRDSWFGGEASGENLNLTCFRAKKYHSSTNPMPTATQVAFISPAPTSPRCDLKFRVNECVSLMPFGSFWDYMHAKWFHSCVVKLYFFYITKCTVHRFLHCIKMFRDFSSYAADDGTETIKKRTKVT